MAGLGTALLQGAGVVGAGFKGLSDDQQLAAKQAALQAEQERQRQNDIAASLQRQFQDQQTAGLNASTIAHNDAETRRLNAPIPDEFEDAGSGSIGGQSFRFQRNKRTNEITPMSVGGQNVVPYASPARDPVKDHEEERAYDLTHPTPEPSHFGTVTVTPPGGEPEVHTYNEVTGADGKVLGGKPQSGGSGIGGQSISPEQIQGMYDRLATDDKAMRAYEQGLTEGTRSISPFTAFSAGVGSADPKGLVGAAESVAGAAGVAHSDPDYQNYLTHEQDFAAIMQQIDSKRATEVQGKIDKSLAGAKIGDVAPTIASKQAIRQTILNYRPPGPKPTVSSGRAGGAGAGTQTPSQLWDAAVQKYGQAKVLQEYGPRPPE